MKYKGSCHCGSVEFLVETDLSKIVQCNCSICKRKNAKMALILKDAITIIRGEENLGTYQFNTEESQIVDVDSHIDFSVVYHMGDINMDININVLDVVHMIDYILSISPDVNPYTDINSDGTVNVMDVILLVSFIFYMP